MQEASEKASTTIMTPIQVPTIDTVDGATVGRYACECGIESSISSEEDFSGDGSEEYLPAVAPSTVSIVGTCIGVMIGVDALLLACCIVWCRRYPNPGGVRVSQLRERLRGLMLNRSRVELPIVTSQAAVAEQHDLQHV